MIRPAQIRNEDGFSLVELMVAVTIGMVVLFGVLAVVQASSNSSSRTTARVAANQIARPELTGIIDTLHSACISPDLAPVQADSTGESITFINSTDRGVAPVPTKRTITLASGSISETVYPYQSGSAPTWVFAPTGTTTRLVTGVTAAKSGPAKTPVPLFRYYDYDDTTATVSAEANPLPVPLSPADAARVVQVTVAFAITPNKNTVNNDPDATVSLTDSALLRFSPASSTAGESLLPCG